MTDVKNKFIKPLIVVAAFLVLALVTTASYAYFTANVSGNDNAFETVIKTGDMELLLDDPSVSFGVNMIPGASIQKNFFVLNTGNVETNYDVYLSELINTFVDKNDLVYTLYMINGTLEQYYNRDESVMSTLTPIASDVVVPSVGGEQAKIISNRHIGVNEAQGFMLVITFKDDGTNQDDNKGRGFSAKISVNEYKESTRVTELLDGPTFNNRITNYSRDVFFAYIDDNREQICNNRIQDSDLTCDEFIQMGKAEIEEIVVPVSMFDVSTEPPGEDVNKINVASLFSKYPIYAWIDSGSFALHIYSEDSNIYMNEDSYHMFKDFKVTSSINLSGLDSSRVIQMHGIFEGCANLQALNLGDKFDTSKAADMSKMFYGTEKLAQLDLGDKFDTSNVHDFSYMFHSAKKLTSLNLGDKFDTSKGVYMPGMFDTMDALETLDLGDKFDTSNVIDMEDMFASMHSLSSLHLGDKFDTSKVEDMSNMFTWMSNATYIDLGDKFNTSKVKDMHNMFYNCPQLTTIYTTQDFDTSSVTNDSSMFTLSKNLVGGAGTVWNGSHINSLYARIDDPTNSKPGYFTLYDDNPGEPAVPVA